MIGLIDCDNFFVSCERAVRPELKEKPVVVLSNNDGCVVARSNEAKRLGIRMGVPVFEIRDLVNSGKVEALSGNHTLYGDISKRTHELIKKFVPQSIDYSIDESFINVSGIPPELLVDFGKEIYHTIQSEIGIPVTIGFSKTNVLSKLAVESIKKTPVHVRLLDSQKEIENLLSSLAVNELWGIGKRLIRRLYKDGVFTAFDFYNRPKPWIRESLGVTGERLWLELHGIPCIEVGYAVGHRSRGLQDSISETRTFPKDISNYDWIESRVVYYLNNCAKRLRRMGGECRIVSVFLRTNRFHTEMEVYNPYFDYIFPAPTSDSVTLTTAVLKGLREIYRDGIRYKRAGVILSKITPATSWTPSIFEDEAQNIASEPIREELMDTIDKLNMQNNLTLRLASELGI